MKQLTQEEKAAVFLGSLSPAVMESVLAKLSPERRTRLRGLAQRPPDATSTDALDPVLREVESMLRNDDPAAAGMEQPVAAARAAGAYGAAAAAAKEDADELAQALGDPVAELARVEPEQLAAALQGENSRTVCLILSQLPIEQAGQLFKRLPGELRRTVSVHFAGATAPPPEVIQRIVQAVVRKSLQLKEKPPEPGPDVRYRNMAGMMRLLEKEERKEVLAALEEHDATAAAAVKGLLYQFEDLLRIEKRSIQRLLGELDTKNLALALKGADPAITEKVLSNMSQRAQQTLNEETELAGTATAAQVEQARKVIVDTIQKLDQAGDLVMLEG
jgi:flagellar motor switch protein FliG